MYIKMDVIRLQTYNYELINYELISISNINPYDRNNLNTYAFTKIYFNNDITTYILNTKFNNNIFYNIHFVLLDLSKSIKRENKINDIIEINIDE